jgi:hypothetical protein
LPFFEPTWLDSATDVQAILAAVIVWATLKNIRATNKIAEANERTVAANQDMVREARAANEMTARATTATEELAREAQFQRLSSTLPVIDLVLHKLSPGSDETTRTFNVDVVNVGLGPAMYLNIRWRWPSFAGGEDPPHPCEHAPFPEQATLAAGQKITLPFSTQWIEPAGTFPHDLPNLGDLEVGAFDLGYLSVTYVDIHERIGEISRTVGLSQRRFTTQVQFFSDEDTRFEVPGMTPWRYRSHLDE